MRVSVIVPAYNAEATIDKAVASALSQTVPVHEIVVGNDGSDDRTSEVASQAGARVLDLPRGNGSIARNAAAKSAEGDLLMFLDADDWWEPGKVERHLRVWSDFQGSLVMDRSTVWKVDGSRSYWMGGLDYEGELDWTAMLSHKAWPSGSSFSVPANTYWKVGGFNENLRKYQDVDFWVRCSHACGPIYNIQESFTNYLLLEGSVSKSTGFVEENLDVLLEGWPFATEAQKQRFRSHAFLMAGEFSPWPKAFDYFRKAHWPVHRKYFWKCFINSLRASPPVNGEGGSQ